MLVESLETVVNKVGDDCISFLVRVPAIGHIRPCFISSLPY